MSELIFDEYQERLERRKRSESAITNFVSAATRWREWAKENGVNPSTPTPDELERYFDEQPLALSTKHLYLKELRAAFSYAHKRGVIRQDPTVDVELPKQAHQTPRILSNEDLREMKARCETDKQMLLWLLLVYTGARRFELCQLEWENINVPGRTIEIIGKGAKRRLVPIHPALGDFLSSYDMQGKWVFPGLKGNYLSDTGLNTQLRKFTPTASFHDFRRTMASSLDANGVAESEINEILGWAKVSIFARHYRAVVPERLQKAILCLYADDPL